MQDPRLSPSAAAFKDAIRRQFNCQQILIDIRSIELHYSNLALSNGKITRDILCGAWKESKRTFADDANTNLVLHVSFEALDDPEQDIFESFEPPPQIAEYFDTESSDVAMNDQALADAAANAFGAEQNSLRRRTSRPWSSIMTTATSPQKMGRGNGSVMS
jgi:hypothetical protein